MLHDRADIINKLKNDILFQRFSTTRNSRSSSIQIRPLTDHFHFKVFPLGAVHEFICNDITSNAASTGFISALLQQLMNNHGVAVWLASSQIYFPPALTLYGLYPEKIIFIQLSDQEQIVYAMEEALKCEGISAVVANVRELNFKQSRRLQLACEKSRVTGFVLCNKPRRINTTACVARWEVIPSVSINENNLPGVGFPSWHIQLQKVKNGKPGNWTYAWEGGALTHIPQKQNEYFIQQKKAV